MRGRNDRRDQDFFNFRSCPPVARKRPLQAMLPLSARWPVRLTLVALANVRPRVSVRQVALRQALVRTCASAHQRLLGRRIGRRIRRTRRPLCA